MRFTPDTGILVRMNVKATGPARRLLATILGGVHELVLSEFLLQETIFSATPTERDAMVEAILSLGATGCRCLQTPGSPPA